MLIHTSDMRVSVNEAKNKLTELIDGVEHGERITICRDGAPAIDVASPKKLR
jgi:prevent-host-death family protein